MERHVIFGSGPVGKSVARALHERGKCQIVMVNRSGKAENLPESVSIVTGDANSLEFIKSVTRNATVVYQCAQPPYHRWLTEFASLQTTILEGAAANGAKLVIADNLYMYADTNGTPLTEEIPQNPPTKKGKLRKGMADEALKAHQDGRLPVVIGRASDFFGPEVLGSVVGERFFGPLVVGKGAEVIGNPNAPHTFTYAPDFGAALVILGECDDAYGQAWHIPNSDPITPRQLATCAAKIAGVLPKITPMSAWMMQVAGFFIPEAKETVEMLYQYEKPYFVDSARFERKFAFRATPIEIALQNTVSWYRAHATKKS